MRRYRGLCPGCLLALLLLLVLQGCDGHFVTGDGDRDVAVTNRLGEAYLHLDYSSETISVRNSSTDAPVGNIQLLGIANGEHRLYVAADPLHEYHPTVTSGESSSYYDASVYLTPLDQRLGTNATSYPRVDAALLDDLTWRYGTLSRSATISGLRDVLATLAVGKAAGLVVCADSPLSGASGMMTVTEVAQRSTTLDQAFQAIGWQYIYTSRGFFPSQSVQVWVIDPQDLAITGSSGGALTDTLLAVVVPSGTPVGAVLPHALKVELTWDAAVDLDLHLVRNGADLYDPLDDCYWKYLEQNWGDPYQVSDNPRVLFDNRHGYGPETVVLDEMTPDDTYAVVVDYWGDTDGHASYTSTTATVRVWTDASETPRIFQVGGLTYGEPEKGQYRVVCDIDGDTGGITIRNIALTHQRTRLTGTLRK